MCVPVRVYMYHMGAGPHGCQKVAWDSRCYSYGVSYPVWVQKVLLTIWPSPQPTVFQLLMTLRLLGSQDIPPLVTTPQRLQNHWFLMDTGISHVPTGSPVEAEHLPSGFS